ncbi:hypothetical protein FisN_2HuN26 [Fistulifera solaris]|uniref:Uncharacterized protein n=1 Tax=Fistulifera solaris TaxID=1519565 RepID=A0A1Z5JI77_FISSO|nr:hypothetical protein FisN_2HuN26 [Fistulifera solaris]|eukprot:GAX13707.1 hypothetical protein FisN_2HuN26 [Fistulifera solaris]
MNEEMQTKDDLLELISVEEMSPMQRELHAHISKDNMFMYRLLRKPTYLDEFNFQKYNHFAIWLDNETMITVTFEKFTLYRMSHIPYTIRIGKSKLHGAIYGRTAADIAETATFFWSLKCLKESDTGLAIDRNEFIRFINIAAILQPDQLAHIMDANPTRHFAFRTGRWNAEMSTVLATRPYPVHLELTQSYCGPGLREFPDGGTAFVEALEKRQFTFGSLSICFMDSEDIPFSAANLERLFRLKAPLEKLEIGTLEGPVVLLPFSAQTKNLAYHLYAEDIRFSDFTSLDIPVKEISFHLGHRDEHAGNQHTLLIAFLNRVATLGHFEKLGISLSPSDPLEHAEVASVSRALIRAVNTNPFLTSLDLRKSDLHFDTFALDWGRHLPALFQAIEEHKGLRQLILREYPKSDPDYSWLKRLLTRTRNIIVLDSSGEKCTDGDSIEKIYSLNRFYHGSSNLVKESLMLRTQLVATALSKGASNTFDKTALLLSMYTDVLCDFVQHGNDVESSVVVSPLMKRKESPASLTRNPEERALKKVRS